MTKKFETVSVEKRVCVRCTCDLCGSEAEEPRHRKWVYRDKNSGAKFKGRGTLWLDKYLVSADEQFDRKLELCPDCTEWLMDNLSKVRSLKRGEEENGE